MKEIVGVFARLMPWLAEKIMSCFPSRRFQRLEDEIAAMANFPDGLEPDATTSQRNSWYYHSEMLEFRLKKLGISRPTTGSDWLRLRVLAARADVRSARKEFPRFAR